MVVDKPKIAILRCEIEPGHSGIKIPQSEISIPQSGTSIPQSEIAIGKR